MGIATTMSFSDWSPSLPQTFPKDELTSVEQNRCGEGDSGTQKLVAQKRCLREAAHKGPRCPTVPAHFLPPAALRLNAEHPTPRLSDLRFPAALLRA